MRMHPPVMAMVLFAAGCRSRSDRVAFDDAAAAITSTTATNDPSPAQNLEITPRPFVHPDPLLTDAVAELQAARGTFFDIGYRELSELGPNAVLDSRWRTMDLLSEGRPWIAVERDAGLDDVQRAASLGSPEILRQAFHSPDRTLDIVLYETKGILLLRVSGSGLPPNLADEHAINALGERVLRMRQPNPPGTPGFRREWRFVTVAHVAMPVFLAESSMGEVAHAWMGDRAVFFACYKPPPIGKKGPLYGPWFDPPLRRYLEQARLLGKPAR